MIHFDLPKQKSSIIKVLGVGGGGSNAVNYMFAQDIEGVDFIICNTDAKALAQSRVPNKIQLGPHLTQGLGAGANPEVGKQATEESLEEIKRILEVNTKMAFICAGMGGGTGTGGAPIIAKICRELGILTVGIVTTPFGFEGPKRLQQAEDGIRKLEPFVDTLLVISNDKLRMQYGNLKMKDAFGKADNVLATAAKCITDIINSRGHIIVDFADVCTVMKNGGVAILGSASIEGEDRAQRTIEEALNSPLLNDNDIRGAKWILININSAEGDDECTMDELEVINNHLRSQAGDEADIIVGMGYDNTLDKKIGITLIATGFEHKDPFAKQTPVIKKQEAKQEKIVLTLVPEMETKKQPVQQKEQLVEIKEQLIPVLSEEEKKPLPVSAVLDEIKITEQKIEAAKNIARIPLVIAEEKTTEEKVEEKAKEEELTPTILQYSEKITEPVKPATTTFLSKPSNIYAEENKTQLPEMPIAATVSAELPKIETIKAVHEEEQMEFQLVVKGQSEIKNEIVVPMRPVIDIDEPLSEEEDQKRRAAERIHKLRNLSYNMGTADVNTEFDSVPAYVRRNMELFGNTLTSVENFYSKYTVKKDENNETQISTINTFLDGKKPD